MNLGVKPLSHTNSSASWKSNDGALDQFPVGLRVLVVDDDPTCLRILEKMLKICLYEVTTSNRAETALKFLRDNKNGYDVVISDVHMPDMDGFKLLEHVGLEMDLPVIMMSADDSKNVVMKGVTHGACDYLIKPVRMEALKNIWQHVVRKKKHEWKDKDFEQSVSADFEQKTHEDFDYSSSANERNSKKRKNEDDEEERDDSSALKKPRVVWSVELHQQFVTAVNQLGIDKAVPKKILELMNVPGLTRENVASHLQKYRLYLRRLSGVQQHQNGLGGNSFVGPTDATFGPITALDLQALAASGQIPPQNLADQRNIFSFENPNLRFIEGQQKHNGNKVNLLHGIPTNMDSKHLASLHQSGPLIGNMNMHIHSQSSQSSSLRTQILNEINVSHLSSLPSPAGRPVSSQAGPGARGPAYSSVVDFSRSQRTDFSRISTPNSNVQDEVSSEMKRARDLVLNYDVFNDVNHNRAQDWRIQTVGSPFEAQQRSSVQGGNDFSPSVLVQSGQSNVNISQQLNSSLADNQLRIKTEKLPDMGFQNGVFDENFGQEDLMSALLKQQETLGHVEGEFVFDGYHLDNLPV